MCVSTLVVVSSITCINNGRGSAKKYGETLEKETVEGYQRGEDIGGRGTDVR